MEERGKFIVFEGIDGCGKSTQLRRLFEALEGLGAAVYRTREPSDGIIGRLIRQAVEDRNTLRDETLVPLFAADRFEHITGEILPRLEKGICVLCDRYVFSSLAYQSMTEPMETVLCCNQRSISTLMPDLTVFLDTPPEVCAERIRKARGRVERFERLESLRTEQQNFYWAFSMLGAREAVLRVEGSESEDMVFSAVFSRVRSLLKLS